MQQVARKLLRLWLRVECWVGWHDFRSVAWGLRQGKDQCRRCSAVERWEVVETDSWLHPRIEYTRERDGLPAAKVHRRRRAKPKALLMRGGRLVGELYAPEEARSLMRVTLNGVERYRFDREANGARVFEFEPDRSRGARGEP